MPLSRGTHYLAIPGPSVVPDAVLRAMHRPSPNIYGGELQEIVETILPDLCTVAGTRGQVAIYISNGHGVWEAALTNVFSRGDHALALGTGIFAHGWADMAERMGVTVERLDFGRDRPADLAAVEAALRADSGHRIKAVMAVQVDTATSVRNDVPGLRAVLDRVGHPALLMVDCIASLAVERFRMDAWGVDVALAASQKGLMTPPGLGFVWFNDRAEAMREQAGLVTPYWDWRPRVAPAVFYHYFCGTAPTHHLYGLRTALDMLLDEGLEAAWYRHAKLAQAVWAAVGAWGKGGPLTLNISDPESRSHAVTLVHAGADHGKRLRDWVSTHGGVTLGIGIGMATPEDPDSDRCFRLGHMGHVNAQMLMGALGVIDIGLKALDIPHGDGALEAASRVLSSA